MEMVKQIAICAGVLPWFAAGAAAADFTLTIGSPIAASGPEASGPADSGVRPEARKKTKFAGLFAVRLEGCATPDTGEVTVTEEGNVNGVRTSAPVSLVAAGSPGVYIATSQGPAREGQWVASLAARCGDAQAGALVPLGPAGFLRERVKILRRPPTKAEVDAALKDLAARPAGPRP